MLLKTFLNKLEYEPESVRHDAYEGKDIAVFKKVDGYFPYIELYNKKDGKPQQLYIDILNWTCTNEKYVTTASYDVADGFIAFLDVDESNTLSAIDAANTRLHAFYMLMQQDKSTIFV